MLFRSEEKKVRVASMEFTEYALVWWDNKNRTGERPATWVDMKRVMRDRFVPASYTRQLHSKLRRPVQGAKTVDEYYKEMKTLMIRRPSRSTQAKTLFLYTTLFRSQENIPFLVLEFPYCASFLQIGRAHV